MTKIKLHSDSDLVVRLKNGDQYAFEILFYKYKSKLKGFVLSLIPPQIDPEEIVQQVFIKIWIQKAKLDNEKSFQSFLYTIAKNEVIDQLRSSVNKKIYLLSSDVLTDLNISDQAEVDAQLELEQKVEDLMKMLPERRRQIFRMSRFDGLSYREIANELNISENTVDTQIRKALNFFRDKNKELPILFLLLRSS